MDLMHRRQDRAGNRLLGALPEEDYRRLAPHLTSQPFPKGYVLQQRDQPVRLVYFPDRSLAWLTSPTEDGNNTQVAMVGREGMVGIEVALGSQVALCDAVVHTSADQHGVAIGVDEFRRELERNGSLARIARHYAGAFVSLLTRWAACNASHSAEQRCCRWLLEAASRVNGPELAVTHELLSDLLGLRRSTVTQILGRLQEAGILTAQRGFVRITEQKQLEQRSCGCEKPVKELLNESAFSEMQMRAG
jgi:CRP-like cAMP-binding protein